MKNTDIEKVYLQLPGLIESENFPTIIDDIGEDVYGIEIQFNNLIKTKAEIILKRDMYEEHICVEAKVLDGEIVLECSNPDFPERKSVYILVKGSAAEEEIIDLCKLAQQADLFGKATDSGFFSHPDVYSED